MTEAEAIDLYDSVADVCPNRPSWEDAPPDVKQRWYDMDDGVALRAPPITDDHVLNHRWNIRTASVNEQQLALARRHERALAEMGHTAARASGMLYRDDGTKDWVRYPLPGCGNCAPCAEQVARAEADFDEFPPDDSVLGDVRLADDLIETYEREREDINRDYPPPPAPSIGLRNRLRTWTLRERISRAIVEFLMPGILAEYERLKDVHDDDGAFDAIGAGLGRWPSDPVDPPSLAKGIFR